MEFGLFFLVQRDEGWSERSVYDSTLQQMLAAESLGYQSVWIAEHCSEPHERSGRASRSTSTPPGSSASCW